VKPEPESINGEVASPCTGVCTLDAGSICIGCGRTLDEIARWSAASSVQRLQILSDIRQRRAEKCR
jgi:predicted Fe-S protein YdhL (DUF1289 family)